MLKKLYIYYFHPSRIREGRAKRRGECKRCGSCCHNLFDLRLKCLFLKKNNLCSVYKIRKYLPIIRQICYPYPSIKEMRIYRDEYKKNKCGYYWDE